MNNQYIQRIVNSDYVFEDNFLEVKRYYLHHTGRYPHVNFVNSIDGEKAADVLQTTIKELIADKQERRWYNKKRKKYQFDKCMLLLKNKWAIELGTGYCEIAHDGMDADLINKITATLIRFKRRGKREPMEINLIVKEGSGIGLKSMEIRKTTLDLDLFYEDEFREIDAVIQRRLSQKNGKGIVLLHGLPGTGKTTYLRYLIGRLKKRVLFLSPSVAGNLMNPDFMDLLIDNPNSVLIIEDAENIITDRSFSHESSVSNLLNISDGLLADFLNVQLICTFNSDLKQVDSALLRKGRLIAQYRFGKLGISKSQRLSDHFGMNRLINEPLTIAEIANPDTVGEKPVVKQKIGFKQQVVMEI